MNETKHTPGPWTACNEGLCKCGYVWCPDYPVAKVTRGEWGDLGMPYGEVPEATAVANARLIAAAPELLFAAEQALMAFEDGYDAPKVRDDLRAAIAKAKGVTP